LTRGRRLDSNKAPIYGNGLITHHKQKTRMGNRKTIIFGKGKKEMRREGIGKKR